MYDQPNVTAVIWDVLVLGSKVGEISTKRQNDRQGERKPEGVKSAAIFARSDPRNP